jgi:hypothetical protein
MGFPRKFFALEDNLIRTEKVYSFCLMVEASGHGYVLHTRRIHTCHKVQNTIRYDIRCKM